MRLAILGDIHGNLEALRAVLRELDSQDIDQILCTGDIVGYGASPGPCIDLIREREIPSVRGNHDAYATEEGTDWRIQPNARTVILWTREQLTDDQRAWLAALPRVIRIETTEVVHSSHVWWPKWAYVLTHRRAIANFLFQSVRVSFNGHSHVPLCVAHQPDEFPSIELLNGSVSLDQGCRFLIGVGSVGQPRDRNPHACCAVYDSDAETVGMVRVPYEIKVAQKKITEAGLPKELARRLRKGL